MIALLTIIALLFVLILILRGPATPLNKVTIKSKRPKSFSKYLVNENGELEMADDDRAK